MRTTIALTGGIASGKSFVADELAALGAVIIDSDVLAREVVAPGTPGLAAIVARFGPDIVQPDGSLDRGALGRIVFHDAAAREDLNAIVHPRVRERARELESLAQPGQVIVHVIPLLVEAGLVAQFDTVWVVDVPVEVQKERLMRRNGMTDGEAQARIASQASRQERLVVADAVIDNSGDPADTAARVRELWNSLGQPCAEGAAW